MIKPLAISNLSIVLEVLELQRLAYSVEAKLIGSEDISPLQETLEDLQASTETFYRWFEKDILAGVIAYKQSSYVLDIHRVIVHPGHFRKGIAKKLISFLETHLQTNKLLVVTASLNLPAVKLYQSLGFQTVRQQEVESGFWLTHFEKTL